MIDWKGQRAFIVASGPSLTAEDVELLRGENVIAVNCSVRLAQFAQVLYACDYKWWAEYQADWRGFEGWKVTIDKRAAEQFGLVLVDLPTGKPTGSSGFQASFLAYVLGAAPIYLLGFDCKPAGESRHWHDDHGRKMNNPTSYTFAGWRKSMSWLHEALQAEGVSLINCTRDTALTIPRKTLESVLDGRR